MRERIEEHVTLTLQALRASGLSAPFGGLVDLYKNGKFTPCGTNETCWEPSREALAQLAMPAAHAPPWLEGGNLTAPTKAWRADEAFGTERHEQGYAPEQCA